jgi:hypothetical protein
LQFTKGNEGITMIQDKIKAQIEQLKGQVEKLQAELKDLTGKQLEQVKAQIEKLQAEIKVQTEKLQADLKTQTDKLQGEANKQIDAIKVESVRILRELGAEVKDDQINVRDVVSELRAANPSLRQFIRNLDVATYDNRFRASWNANMSAAYAKLQAEKTFIRDIKPRIEEARAQVEAQVSKARTQVGEQVEKLQTRAQELRTKVAS